MNFRVGDATDLAKYVLAKFTNTPEKHPSIEHELVSFFWNSASYRVAMDFESTGAQEVIKGGQYFVYDQKSGLIFFDVSFGKHHMLMAHFGALHMTDFSKDSSDWNHEMFVEPWNAEAKMVEFFLEKGHGLFQSRVGAKETLRVSGDFKYSPQERLAFSRFDKVKP